MTNTLINKTGIRATMGSAFGGALLLLVLMIASAAAQTVTYYSPTKGSTPEGLAPGSPAGSYPLSGFDTLNPFNGGLNFRLPLLQIGGRGSAGYTMTLPIERKWRINKTVTDTRLGCPACEEHFVKYQISASGDWWHSQEMLAPGAMYARGSGHNLISGCYSDTQHWQYTLTRLTFVAPDGTEYEFRDKLSGGKPLLVQNCAYGPSRGYEFVTADGTSATFVSDHKIDDSILPASGEMASPATSGHLLMRDGTRYRIDDGKVSWIRDRNGNTVRFLPGKIIDSLNREVTITTGTAGSQVIKFNGFNGAQRQIRIEYSSLAQALLPANDEHPAETIKGYAELFPEITDWGEYGPGGEFNTQVVSAVVLPDGRSYRFFYNSYAELARVELPTGGAFEYDWTGSVTGGGGSFETGPNYEVTRRVVAKRTYREGGRLESKLELKGCPDTVSLGQMCVQVDQTDPYNHNQLLERTKHFYYGGGVRQSESDYSHWLEGKEFKTEMVGSDGVTVLKRVETKWAQRASLSGWPSGPEPENDPRIVDTITTLMDSGQVAKRSAINPQTQAVGFDQFNNPTDVWEFGYGQGSPGPLLRHTHTDYVTSANYIGTNYTAVHNGSAAHLRSLPLQQWVSSDIDGSNKQSLTTYEYDNYSNDATHAPLIDRAYISGLCTTFTFGACGNASPTGYHRRGNITSVTSYTNAASQTSPVTIAMQYDVAGNMVKFLDARSIASQQYYATVADYADSFGIPDGEARTDNSAIYAPELASRSQRSYAFATSVTNPLGQTVYAQFSYYLGKVVDAEDADGITASGYYNDRLDRPTQVIDAANIPALRRQSSFDYDDDDAARRITVASDGEVYHDNQRKSEMIYDGLGRTVETRSYEDNGNYITTKQAYDGLGRVIKATNPYRTTSDPTYSETKTKYDGLGRVIEVKTTSDEAKVLTVYNGNTFTVTDQAGKQRKSVMDSLGRIVSVYEAPNFPGNNYETRYQYNVLDNLTKVIQGPQNGSNDQIRTFVYDGLSRLTSATNPESGSATNPGGTTSYQYDPNGNLEVKISPRLGNDGITHYKAYNYYDALNRVTKRIYNDGTPEVKYFYDAQSLPAGAPSLERGASTGQLLAMTYGGANSINGTYYGYDSIGKAVKSTQVTDGQAFPMEYEYDLSGGLTRQKYPSGREVTTAYDQVGRLESVSGQKAGETAKTYLSSPEYSAHGGITTLKLGNGLWEHTSFNKRLQPTEIKLGTQSNPESVLKLGYSYGTADNNGNVQSQKINVPGMSPLTQTYTYDGLNRLVVANETGNALNQWQQYYGYDRFGNRRFIPEGTNLPAVLDHTNNPQISPANNRLFGFGYDLAGNVTRDATNRTYEYDGENRMVRFNGGANPNTGGADYSYDGDGKRVKKVTATGTTLFVYDANGTIVAEYSTAAAQRNGTSYLTSDVLGTPRVITTNGGEVKSRHDYLPFGEELYAGIGGRTEQHGYIQDTVRQKFTGYERDSESGLDYAKARYYASGQGRFTSVDSLMASGLALEPQTWNRYVYVTNNPLRYIDTDGRVRRDNEGKVIFIRTGTATPSHDGAPGVGFRGEVGYIIADDGVTRIQAFRQDPAIDDRMRFDCHGLTFADGQLWINDDQVKALLKGDGYVETDRPQVGDIVIYTVSGEVVHSAYVTAVDAAGNVTEVTGLGGINIVPSSTTPRDGWDDPRADITYYRNGNDRRTAQQRRADAQAKKEASKNVLSEKDLKELGKPPKFPKPPKPKPEPKKKSSA